MAQEPGKCPTIARRRLSRELRRLRHEAGLAADKIRGDVGLSQGKMNRLETGIGPQPNISDTRGLLDYWLTRLYGAVYVR
ncbi:Uncharacterised protein [Mycobacterium tuberculosis]|nr:Uncharacterised protein [Mycobacterium tuberculosis]